MRTYVVQRGDSPAKIAIGFAGCPKCACDLVDANPQKPSVTADNGYRTFESLQVGEQLNLPDKWFDGTLDRLPRRYFDELPAPRAPRPQGVGAGSFGTLGWFDSFGMTVSTGGLTGQALASAVQAAFVSSGLFTNVQTGIVSNGQTFVDVAACHVSQQPLDVNSTISIGGASMGVLALTKTGSCFPHIGPIHTGGGGGQQQGGTPQKNPQPQGGGVFTFVQGHRIRSTATTNGPLPAQMASETVASMQAQFDAAHPGQYHVVSVDIATGNQVNVVADYCGPNRTIPSPSQSVFGGVTVVFTYQDLGVSPAGTTCAPSPSSSSATSGSSTGIVVGVIAAAVLAAGAFFALK